MSTVHGSGNLMNLLTSSPVKNKEMLHISKGTQKMISPFNNFYSQNFSSLQPEREVG